MFPQSLYSYDLRFLSFRREQAASFNLSCHINHLSSLKKNFLLHFGRIRNYLPLDPLKRLVNALVISHLDYCNSLLYGLPSNKLAKLKRVQNTSAKLIVGTRRFDNLTPILRDLNWLSIPARLEFKILLFHAILSSEFLPPLHPLQALL